MHLSLNAGPLKFALGDPPKITTPSGARIEGGEHGRSGKDRWGSDYLRQYQSWLGQFDPEKISLSTIKKMRTHPALALGMQIICAPLVNAKWEVVCADEKRKAFLAAVMRDIFVDTMLSSLTAIEFGFATFTKEWGVQRPVDDQGNDVWYREDIDPVIVTKIKQLDPETVKPLIVKDEFKGIAQYGGGIIDPEYVCWITHARHRVFGNLWGWPLLVNAYKLWWSSGFRYALRDRHIEDRIVPPIIVRHPPGFYEDPATGAKKFYRADALQIGRDIRSGESVAMSSEAVGDDTDKPTSRYKWDASFLQGGENVDAFIKLDDADDVRMLMSLLIPPQAVLNAKGGLGSQAVAESLGNLFWDTEVIRMTEIQEQLSKYLVEPISLMNFGPGPRASIRSTAFLKSDIELISQIFKIVSNRMDVDPSLLFDWKAMSQQVGLPWQDSKSWVKEEKQEPLPAWAQTGKKPGGTPAKGEEPEE